MGMLIYGAYGYTGRLIAREAHEQGHRPILAGRDPNKLEALGTALELPTRVVGLDEAERLRSVLDETSVVLHCAGPYVHTARPMVDACLETGTHYLDLTGEATVFRALANRSTDAEEAGVMLLPGIGFDVVTSDCMGALVAQTAARATTLEVALYSKGGVSRGTLRTVVENIDRPGLVRREGRLRDVPHGWTSRTVDFGDRSRHVVSIPEGSVVTSGYSTDVPNVTTYFALPKIMERLLRVGRYAQGFASWAPVQSLLREVIDRRAAGPTDEERARGRTIVWASAGTRTGSPATARFWGPDAYTFTARSAVRAAERVLDGEAVPGYQTPATAFGPDFPLDIAGVEREWVQRPR